MNDQGNDRGNITGIIIGATVLIGGGVALGYLFFSGKDKPAKDYVPHKKRKQK